MKLLLTFLLPFFLFLSSQAQLNPKFTWGAELPSAANMSAPHVLGHTEDAYFVYHQTIPSKKNSPFKVELLRLDQAFNINQKRSFQIRPIAQEEKYCATFMFNERIYMLFVRKLGPDRGFQVIAVEHDKETLMGKEETILYETVKYKMPNPYDLDFYFSPDKSKLAVFWHKQVNQKKLEVDVFFHVYDQNLNRLWGKEIPQYRQGQAFLAKNFKINNAGEVVVGGFLFKGKKKDHVNGQQQPNYTYTGTFFQQQGADSFNFELDLGDKFIRDVKLKFTHDNKLIGAGFYKILDPRKAWLQVYHGTFFSFIEPGELDVKVTPLVNPESIDEDNKDKRSRKTALGGYYPLYLKESPSGEFHLAIFRTGQSDFSSGYNGRFSPSTGGNTTFIFRFDTAGNRVNEVLTFLLSRSTFPLGSYDDLEGSFDMPKMYYLNTFIETTSKTNPLSKTIVNTFFSTLVKNGSIALTLDRAENPKQTIMPHLSYILPNDLLIVFRKGKSSRYQIGLLKIENLPGKG